MKITDKAINELKMYENNPRKNDEAVDAVAASIEEFGFKVPIVIDKDNVIIAGHTRIKAAKQLGFDKVPCIIADDLSDEQVKAFRLADNKVSEFSEWDFEVLDIELEQISDIDMEQFGFGFLDEGQEVIEDDFDATPPEEPTTKLGDIWQLGRHRLMCGDATDVNSVKDLMGGALADMYLTDPPYNVGYVGKTKDALTIQNDEMKNDDFRAFLASAFFAADSILKPGAVFYIWHADYEGYNFRSACIDTEWIVRQCLIWAKNQMVMGRQDYQWQHEPCLYGWKDGAAHLWAADRKQTTILHFDKPSRSAEHPTMKPVKLFDYQIRNNTKGEDIVFDGFAGSGTTLVACEQNGRNAYCMELDPGYCDVIIKRWEELTGEKAQLITE